MIFQHAFSPAAATGGFAGASIAAAMRFGIARGVFSNESGLGSAPIAAAAARTNDPVKQALVSMTQTFIDTLGGLHHDRSRYFDGKLLDTRC